MQILKQYTYIFIFHNIKMSTMCNKCEDKAWCWSCDESQSKTYLRFICIETIPYRDSHSHMSKHYNDPNQY